MIKAVLFDLDDTLIASQTNIFFPRYLRMLGEATGHIAAPEVFIQRLLAAYDDLLNTYDPTSTLYERLLARLAETFQVDMPCLEDTFDRFYTVEYPVLASLVLPVDGALSLLKHLSSQGYNLVVATNPGLPFVAICQRMAWGGLPIEETPVGLVTTLDTMHFGKPQPHYYAEIVARLDIDPGEALMVGDDWENDMVGASKAGLHTFWITDNSNVPPDGAVSLSGQGSLADFIHCVSQGWLEELDPRLLGHQEILHLLEVYPAVIDTERRRYGQAMLECSPGSREWSARDIVCHLRDHEKEDRLRLRRLLDEENPFLPANTDPWADYHGYRKTSLNEALRAFSDRRAETVDCLRNLPEEAWQRPGRDAIFGPTTFEEMVRFIVEHDRTHLRQMRDAIHTALNACG